MKNRFFKVCIFGWRFVIANCPVRIKKNRNLVRQDKRRRCVLFTGIDGHDTYSCERADQRAAVRRLLSVIRRTARTSRSVESVLLYARGYSYDEIAAMEGIPVGTVKSRVATGRRLLRRALER